MEKGKPTGLRQWKAESGIRDNMKKRMKDRNILLKEIKVRLSRKKNQGNRFC